MPKQTLIPIIGIPIPPGLARSFGYTGPGRYLGAWWEHCADDLCLCDGRRTSCGMGQWYAWKIYIEHPAILPFVGSYFFGAVESPASHALVIDQAKNRIMVGTQKHVLQFLKDNAPPLDPQEQHKLEKLLTLGSSLGGVDFDMDGHDPTFRSKQIMDDSIFTIPAIAAELRVERENNEKLQTWLDSQSTPFSGRPN